jgi:hypothetical protein
MGRVSRNRATAGKFVERETAELHSELDSEKHSARIAPSTAARIYALRPNRAAARAIWLVNRYLTHFLEFGH